MRKIRLFIKRAFDIVAALILVIILTVIPVLIVTPILIKLTSRGPAVFKQERVGRGGKVFKIYKFRTMRIPADSLDENGVELPPKKRITRLGAFLRKTSLDELMQLFNIIGGSMSFVGPRPTLPYQVERYTDRQRKRLDMRPGITGWAQVNGRNDLTWSEKIEYDIEYVEKFSLLFDIKIFFKTVGVVLRGGGIAFTKNDRITEKTAVPEASAEATEQRETVAASLNEENEK